MHTQTQCSVCALRTDQAGLDTWNIITFILNCKALCNFALKRCYTKSLSLSGGSIRKCCWHGKSFSLVTISCPGNVMLILSQANLLTAVFYPHWWTSSFTPACFPTVTSLNVYWGKKHHTDGLVRAAGSRVWAVTLGPNLGGGGA